MESIVDNFELFKEQVKGEMASCRYNMETQPMSRALAKSMFDIAKSMRNTYELMKAESGIDDDRLVVYIGDWYDYSKRIYQNVNALSELWNTMGIPAAKEQDEQNYSVFHP